MTVAAEVKRSSDFSALERWRSLYAPEMVAVNGVIMEMVQGEPAIIPEIAEHLLKAGGKRLRPILTIIAAKLCGYAGGSRHVKQAACVEFIHTATLLHDDVVDESSLRRGLATANRLWGNAPSVLVGDYLLSRAFQLMARDESKRVVEVLSDAAAVITQGELHQLGASRDIELSEADYFRVIGAKTSELFAAACRIGAVIAGRPQAEERALYDFGHGLGTAFQIIDDVLDYSAAPENFGKQIGNDFREGKVTLPVILSYKQGTEEERGFWRDSISGGKRGPEQFARAAAIMRRTKALDSSIAHAREVASKAAASLNGFPPADERSALLDILSFSVDRAY